MMKFIALAFVVIAAIVAAFTFIVDNDYLWIVWIVLALIVVALMGFGVFYFLKKKKEKQNNLNEQEILLKQDKEIIKHLFELSLKEVKNGFYNFKKPLYVMFGFDNKEQSILLEQNSLIPALDGETITIGNDDITAESDSYFKFWHSDKAIVIQLGHRIFDDEGADPELLNEFFSILYKYRGQQSCNGLIYTLSCKFVQMGDHDYHVKIINKVRDAILNINNIVKLDIPVFITLTNADSIADFVPFYKNFEDYDVEKPLGLFIENKDRKHFDFDDYEAKYKNFVEYFAKKSFKFIKNISEEETRSILSLPYQLGIFFNLLEENIRIFTIENKLKKTVWIRGLFFVVTNPIKNKYDLLGQLISYRANFNTNEVINEQDFEKKRYFAKNLIEQAIIPSASIVGINISKKITSINAYIFKIVCVCSILISIGWFYCDNWFDYVELREEIQKTVENYHNSIDQIDFEDPKSLDGVVSTLNNIRLLTQKVDKEYKFYNVVSFDQIAINNKLKNFYQEQLNNVLLKKIEQIIRTSLYREDILDNNDMIYNGTGSYMMLYDKKILDVNYFWDYLSNNVLPYYNFDENYKTTLKIELEDLFKTQYDKTEIYNDPVLLNALNQKMNSTSIEDMLYELVKLNPKNSVKVDVSKYFGKNFNSVFKLPSDFDGYKIPYMYTKEGFLTINLFSDSEEIKRLLKNLKLIKPNIDLSDESIRKITAKVQQHYYSDYIDYWMELINSIELKDFNSYAEVSNALEKLSATRDGALETFIKYFVQNTYLTDVYKNQDTPESSGDEKDKDKKEVIEKKEDHLDGRVIASEFVDIYDFVGVKSDLTYTTDASKSYGLLMEKLKNLNTEFKNQNKNSAQREQSIYKFVTSNSTGAHDSFDLLAVSNEDTPFFFEQIIERLYTMTTSVFNDIATNYVRSSWNNVVVNKYNLNLKDKFPINIEAEKDVTIAHFDEFFKPSGVFDEFYEKYLKSLIFKDEGGDYFVKGNDIFSISIPSFIFEQLKNKDEIQKIFYKEGKLSLKFKLTPRKLSQNSNLFKYNDGVSECIYNQGPRQSCSVLWPTSGNNDVELSFLNSKNSYSYGRKFHTQWGLIKVMNDKRYSIMIDDFSKGNQQWVYKYDDFSISYDVEFDNPEINVSPYKRLSDINIHKW